MSYLLFCYLLYNERAEVQRSIDSFFSPKTRKLDGLTPLDSFLLGALKNAVYVTKPRTLQDLRRETEIARAAVPLATIQKVCQSVARRCQQCIAAAAGGGYFEHL
jgi:hypothetical protein